MRNHTMKNHGASCERAARKVGTGLIGLVSLIGGIAILLSACSVPNPQLHGTYPAQKPKPVFEGPAAVVMPTPPVFPDVKQPNKPEDWSNFEREFAFFHSEATAKQEKHNENAMSVYFQVEKDGKSVNDLKESQIRLKENGFNVTGFKLGADTEKLNQVADIVFLVDITGTMVQFIETAKKRLKEFIRTSRERGFHTRMCISTFGDYVVKKCSRFFDNNPRDKSTETQVRELLNELSRLQAYRGQGKDPGWPDLDENPMGALVEAAQAPWGEDSQRFVILVTDWGFLYSPENQGTIGDKAPAMKQVTEAIKASQMKVFAVTRTQHVHNGEKLVWDGYNTPFQGEPSIVQSSTGEHFDFDRVIRGEVPLDHILERILLRINTTYKASYVVDQVPGLDPSLSIEQRKVEVSLVDPNLGAVKKATVLSSMPKGRPIYKQSWKISEDSIRRDSIRIYQDGQEVTASEYSINGGEVTFRSVPKPGVSLKFLFYYEAPEKNLRLVPMTLPAQLNSQNSVVYLNDIQARAQDVILEKDTEGNTSLSLAESALATNDPYNIRKLQRVKVKAVLTR